MARQGNILYQLLNVHGINEVRNIEIHTKEPLGSEPRDVETELAIEKLKRHIPTEIDQIQTEMFTAVVEQIAMRHIILLFVLK